jgi:hypothetical protein
MGHTIYPMRWIIYDKMQQLKKLVKALREPEKTAALSLVNHIYQNISAISYANPLPQDVENNMIFSILLQEKRKGNAEIDNFTLLIFSLMVICKFNQLKNPDERNIHRLLQKERQNNPVG